MTLIKACIIAFSMYSVIPLPQVEWDEKSMRYAMLFFPWVGAGLGALFYAWWILCEWREYPVLLRAGIGTALPILYTGGIHMDGFLDTMDAIHSYQPREEKLRIMKDPHIGAFALISAMAYSSLYFGGVAALQCREQVLMAACGFVMSRILSALSLVLFPQAKKEGLVHSFSSLARKKLLAACMLAAAVLLTVLMAVISPVRTVMAAVVFTGCFGVYYYVSKKEFGGINGDQAGCFLTITELLFLYALVL